MVSRVDNFCRFMAFVERTRGDVGCWIWTGNNVRGYGHMSLGKKIVKAHRWIYEFVTGKRIPTGMLLRHHCDNPSCVNPKHLEPGTPQQNATDMVSRGRNVDRRGEKHPLARLNADKVLEIRRLASMGRTHQKLAEQYGIARQHITKIVTRNSWGHI